MREYVVNLFEFARTGMIAEGDLPVQELPRMLTEVPAAVPVTERLAVVFHWRAQGFEHSEHRADGGVAMRQYLRLAVAGDMWLECQRCMTPYRHPMATETVFEVVRDEAQADACLAGSALEDHAEDGAVGRSQGETDSDFTDAAGGGVGHDAVGSDRGEDEGDDRESKQNLSGSALAGGAREEEFVHGLEAEERLLAVELPDGGSHGAGSGLAGLTAAGDEGHDAFGGLGVGEARSRAAGRSRRRQERQ